MLHLIIALAMRLNVTDADAEALRRTAPEPVSLEQARENIAAARYAGMIYDLDPDLLLSIAAHESHYKADAVGPEPGGKVSCGSMTPIPVASCKVAPTVLEGYLAGAHHLRVDWLGAVKDETLALRGYAGGYALIRACALGPVEIRPGVDGCKTPDVFRARASWIKRERRVKASS